MSVGSLAAVNILAVAASRSSTASRPPSRSLRTGIQRRASEPSSRNLSPRIRAARCRSPQRARRCDATSVLSNVHVDEHTTVTPRFGGRRANGRVHSSNLPRRSDTCLASAAVRRHFSGSTILRDQNVVCNRGDHFSFVHRPRSGPARAAASAVARISGVFCALKCGRSLQLRPAKNSAIFRMLPSRTAMSTMSVGSRCRTVSFKNF